MLLSAGAVILAGAAGALYIHTGSEIASQQDKLSLATAQLTDLQSQIDVRLPVAGSGTTAGIEATPAAVEASVATTNVDWLAVERAVEASGAPFGVVISSMQGVVDPSTAVAATPGSVARPGTLTLDGGRSEPAGNC